jgi:uncharacterized PurR-regulated membrane protein YhhQ (DUF165 family)
MTIAFAGVMSNRDIISVIIWGYLAKVAYEAAMTPVTYAVVNWLKRVEGVDILDRDTDFNPFRVTAG